MTLSPRLRQVLGCIAQGLCEKETGRALGLSHKTIKVHRRRLLNALNAHNAPHAVSIAYERGLLPLDNEARVKAHVMKVFRRLPRNR